MCYLPAGRSVQGKTVTEVLKMLPEAAGRGQHFQVQGHSFSLYGPTLSRPINFFFLFILAVNWLTREFVYATLPLRGNSLSVLHSNPLKYSND